MTFAAWRQQLAHRLFGVPVSLPGAVGPAEPAAPLSPFSGTVVRAALVIGLGIAFGLWALAGYLLTQRITSMELQTATLSTRYIRADDALETVRAQVLASSVFVGDALLDPDPTTDDGFRQRVKASSLLCDGALRTYVPVLNPGEELQRIGQLRQQVDAFYREMFDVLATDTQEWPRDALRLLQERVDPRRDAV